MKKHLYRFQQRIDQLHGIFSFWASLVSNKVLAVSQRIRLRVFFSPASPKKQNLLMNLVNPLLKPVLLFLAAFAVSTSSYALQEYYSISKSMRSLGMGGAFYGLSDDEYALFYNPAGLALYPNRSGQIMLSIAADADVGTLSAISKITSQKNAQVGDLINTLGDFAGKPIYAGATVMPYYVKKNFAIALLLADAKADVAVLGRNFDTSLDFTGILDTGLFMGFADSFLDDTLHLGVNLKGMARAGGHKNFSALDIAQGQSFTTNANDLGGVGGGADIDLGSTYDLQDMPFGLKNQVSLVINNVFGSKLSSGGTSSQPPALPRMLSLGAHTVLPGYGWIDNFHILLDLAEFRLGGEPNPDFGARTGSFWKHINWGVEMPMGGWFVLRSGFRQGNFTAGIGIRTMVLQLDVATWGEELFLGVDRLTSRRVGLRLALGWGSPPPPPVGERSRESRATPIKVDKPQDKTDHDFDLPPSVVEPERKDDVTPKPVTPSINESAPSSGPRQPDSRTLKKNTRRRN